MALEHEISYRKPAFLHDQVTAHVRLGRVRRESAFFETLFQRDRDVIAEVQSRWCCIEASTRTPARISTEIERCFLPAQTEGGPSEINRACRIDVGSAMLRDDR
ncbi:acyl-CoA thioesterase [Novosphingobium sp. CCH12-A3]|uniref:acyl-CoA thioesterase n=1 Tax=Novosphingobium sp. CCH12-A3 TaxID=1768752 RepID=UPI003517D628